MATSRPSKFPRVPYGAIRYHVGKFHVGTPAAEIAADVEKAARKASRLRNFKHAKATEAEVRECVRYALAVHIDNRKAYRAVMRGF